MAETKKIKFPKKIKVVHIPFTPTMRVYDELYDQLFNNLSKITIPKTVKRVEAKIQVVMDLINSDMSYKISEILLIKK